MNFGNTITEILRKSKSEKKEMMRLEGERKSNFDIGVTKIPKKKEKRKKDKYFGNCIA